jgi:DNA-binding XRE family transcriptional regulator
MPDPLPPKTFGHELRRRRQSMQITQTALAKRVGLSRQNMNNIENGRNWPALPIYFGLCRELGMTPPPFAP